VRQGSVGSVEEDLSLVGYDEDLNCLATQNGSSQLFQNVCNYLPVNMATYSRKQIDALLGYYMACSGNSSLMLQDDLWSHP